MNLLIVDDDEIARMSLANILAGLGRVHQAEDGEDAWQRLEGGLRVEVCCCDIHMPRLDGLGFLARARAHPVQGDLPVILISSASDRQTVETAVAAGVAGYILKPFLAVQTYATVERVMRERVNGEAENVLATGRRLAVEPPALAQQLRQLHDDALHCAQAPAPDALQRLFSGAQSLGLWRAGALLKTLMATPMAPHARVVLEEVARLAQCQADACGAGSAK